MKTFRIAILLLGTVVAPVPAFAQTPDNPDRKETTRERENTERRPDPGERNNTERVDPLMSAELQNCYTMPDEDRERCVVAVKRKFGIL
jgi:hypothetical protein